MSRLCTQRPVHFKLHLKAIPEDASLGRSFKSKCFDAVYCTSDNIVVAAPTGSGKTALMELAICRLLLGLNGDQYKIVYQAPTKSLCAERYRDWQAKFGSLKIQCAERTGDTEVSELRNVQHASIIITTPEKWDSVTRKWKDHARLMQLVKLFLIDEVHSLKDPRGATLEAVVSRMKSVGTDVRFIALSATVPNLPDVASWLGKTTSCSEMPAYHEKFGEEFRPVRLQKYVYGYSSGGNDFVLDKFCDSQASTVSTAKVLSIWWSAKSPRDRPWPSPTQVMQLQNGDARACATSAVAFHHAGLALSDRQSIEKGYLGGQLSVICCTSTLAVGVNLPCHLVIIKNTVSWQTGGLKEYSDLEIMQMLGRAGRPQFDDEAVGIIMTSSEKVGRYETTVSGQEVLESCLHLNLIEHMNAEIGLGTISDLPSARRWLKGTFLYVRLRQNPQHYRLEEDRSWQDTDQLLAQICNRDIDLLCDAELVSREDKLKCTELGESMARHYVKFETMLVFLGLKEKARMSEILSALAQAAEFKEVRMKAAEKSLYKEYNKSNGIMFPIKVDLALVAHKVSLIIQAELGGVEYPVSEQFKKHHYQHQVDQNVVFQQVRRLINCVVDCMRHRKDSVAVRNGLELARSLAARAWDSSALQLKQVENVGIAAARKLSAAGINSIDALEGTEAHRIEMILSRNPPFGSKMLAKLKDFPKLRVSAKVEGKSVKAGEPVKVRISGQIGFMNERPPTLFGREKLFVCFLAETSDGQLLDFGRLSAAKLGQEADIAFVAPLTNATQYVSVYVMCEQIAGSMRYVELRPEVPLSLFPPMPRATLTAGTMGSNRENQGSRLPVGRSRDGGQGRESTEDDFEDAAIGDSDLQAIIGCLDYSHIDRFADASSNLNRPGPDVEKQTAQPAVREMPTTQSLPNGKWPCNHRCKDKTTCKHLCCRHGLDRPPKSSKSLTVMPVDRQLVQNPTATGPMSQASASSRSAPARAHLNSSPPRHGAVEFIDLVGDKGNLDRDTIASLVHQKPSESAPKDRDRNVAKPPGTFPLMSGALLPPRASEHVARDPDTVDTASTYDDSLSDLEDGLVRVHDSLLLESQGSKGDSSNSPVNPADQASSSIQVSEPFEWSSSPKFRVDSYQQNGQDKLARPANSLFINDLKGHGSGNDVPPELKRREKRKFEEVKADQAASSEDESLTLPSKARLRLEVPTTGTGAHDDDHVRIESGKTSSGNAGDFESALLAEFEDIVDFY
ncbi:MAG: hypothetical protein M1825_006057 [Sarcosagium campestre]|nr:MAG: hypothetical protein M1825_006057 [Sarcosagium campestre]